MSEGKRLYAVDGAWVIYGEVHVIAESVDEATTIARRASRWDLDDIEDSPVSFLERDELDGHRWSAVAAPRIRNVKQVEALTADGVTSVGPDSDLWDDEV